MEGNPAAAVAVHPPRLGQDGPAQLHRTASALVNQPEYDLHESEQHLFPRTQLAPQIGDRSALAVVETQNGDLSFDQTASSVGLGQESGLDGNGLETQYPSRQASPPPEQLQSLGFNGAAFSQTLSRVAEDASTQLDAVSRAIVTATATAYQHDDLAKELFPSSPPATDPNPDTDGPDFTRDSQKENAPSHSHPGPQRHSGSPRRQLLGVPSSSSLNPAGPQPSARAVEEQLVRGKGVAAVNREDAAGGTVLVPNSSSMGLTEDDDEDEQLTEMDLDEPGESSGVRGSGPEEVAGEVSPSQIGVSMLRQLKSDHETRSPFETGLSPIRWRTTVPQQPQARYQSAAAISQTKAAKPKRRQSDFNSDDDSSSFTQHHRDASRAAGGESIALELDEEKVDELEEEDGEAAMTLVTMPRPTAEQTRDMTMDDEGNQSQVLGRILPPTQPLPQPQSELDADETDPDTFETPFARGAKGLPSLKELLDGGQRKLDNSHNDSSPASAPQQPPKASMRFNSDPRISDMLSSQSQGDPYSFSQMSLPGATQPHLEIEHLVTGRGAFYTSASEPGSGSLRNSSGNLTQLEPTQVATQAPTHSAAPTQVSVPAQVDDINEVGQIVGGGGGGENDAVAAQAGAEPPAFIRHRTESNNSAASKRSRQSSTAKHPLKRITFNSSPEAASPAPLRVEALIEHLEEVPPSPSQSHPGLLAPFPYRPQLDDTEGTSSPYSSGDGAATPAADAVFHRQCVGAARRTRPGRGPHPLAVGSPLVGSGPNATQVVDDTVELERPPSDVDDVGLTEPEDGPELVVVADLQPVVAPARPVTSPARSRAGSRAAARARAAVEAAQALPSLEEVVPKPKQAGNKVNPSPVKTGKIPGEADRKGRSGTKVVHKALAPTFESSPLSELEPTPAEPESVAGETWDEEETNYDLAPHMSPKKSKKRPLPRGTAKAGAGRKPKQPTAQATASAEPVAGARRRRSDMLTADEAAAEAPVLKKPRTRAKGKAKATAPEQAAPVETVAAKDELARHRTRSSTVGSVHGGPPQDDHSINSNDVSVDSGGNEDGGHASEDVKPVMVAKSRLSRSTPFTRVFAIWPEGRYEGGQAGVVDPSQASAGSLFPGTIIKVKAGGMVQVVFDDGSTAPDFEWAKLRKCQLKQGDLVYYRGEDEMTDTRGDTLLGGSEVAVYATETGQDHSEAVLEDKRDELGRRDLVVVTTVEVGSDQQAGAKQHKLELSAVSIKPSRLSQLDDRRFTQSEIMRIQAKPNRHLTAGPIEPLDLVPIPPTAPLKPAKPMRRLDGLFSRIGFLTTFVDAADALDAGIKKRGTGSKRALGRNDELKDDFHKTIEQHGGVRLEIGHLFKIEDKGIEGEVQVAFEERNLAGLDQIVLVADRHSTTPKYLVSLALGIPIISHRYIHDAISDKHALDWRPYAIGAGEIAGLGIPGLGGQWRALARADFSARAVADGHARESLFAGDAFLVVLGQRGRAKPRKADSDERAKQVLMRRVIIGAAGARRVDFVEGIGKAGGGAGYDYVLLEGGEAGTKLKGHKGVASMDWVKECLKAGRKVALVIGAAVGDK